MSDCTTGVFSDSSLFAYDIMTVFSIFGSDVINRIKPKTYMYDHGFWSNGFVGKIKLI